jgi:hypothetical protein
MLFQIRRPTLLDIAPRSTKPVLIPTPGNIVVSWRGRRSRINNNRLMNATSQSDGQQERDQNQPFLHGNPRFVDFHVPPVFRATLPD